MGDYAFPCFKLSRTLRMGPPQIAAKLAGAIDAGDLCQAKQMGGYLNFFLNRENFARRTLESVLAADGRSGAGEEGKGKTICLDFSSINIAKRFHIGHLSTTMIGQSLRRIFDFLGYKTVAINYLGDWGTQFGKLICAYKLWGNREEVEEGSGRARRAFTCKFHEEAGKHTPNWRTRRATSSRRIEDGDEENTALCSVVQRDHARKIRRRSTTAWALPSTAITGESFYNDKVRPRR